MVQLREVLVLEEVVAFPSQEGVEGVAADVVQVDLIPVEDGGLWAATTEHVLASTPAAMLGTERVFAQAGGKPHDIDVAAASGAAESEATGGGRLPEVGAALAILAALILIELALFQPNRVMDDAADMVTLCGFGGLAMAALRTSQHRTRRWLALASAPLGIVGALSVLHGGRLNDDGTFVRGGFVLAHPRVEGPGWQWEPTDVATTAMLVGLVLAVAAYFIQIAVEGHKPGGEKHGNVWQVLALVAVVVMGAAAALIAVVLGTLVLAFAELNNASSVVQLVVALAAVVLFLSVVWVLVTVAPRLRLTVGRVLLPRWRKWRGR